MHAYVPFSVCTARVYSSKSGRTQDISDRITLSVTKGHGDEGNMIIS